jgi:hypothetical protein
MHIGLVSDRVPPRGVACVGPLLLHQLRPLAQPGVEELSDSDLIFILRITR